MSESSAGHLTNERLLSPPSPTTTVSRARRFERPSLPSEASASPMGQAVAARTGGTETSGPATGLSSGAQRARRQSRRAVLGCLLWGVRAARAVSTLHCPGLCCRFGWLTDLSFPDFFAGSEGFDLARTTSKCDGWWRGERERRSGCAG